MLPLVINNNPTRLVQVVMAGSVGSGGGNANADVVLIQSMLNRVPALEGGPEAQLKVDGIAGSRTIAAIRRYQQAHTKVVDGRVDAMGPTVKSLATLLNDRNALPAGLANLGPPNPTIAAALTSRAKTPVSSRAERGGKTTFAAASRAPLAAKSTLVAAPKRIAPAPASTASRSGLFVPTGWDFVTSSGMDLSVKFISLGIINIFMQHDIEPGLTYRFTFAGSGVGLSVPPAGVDVSLQSMPSTGTRLVKVNPLLGKDPPIFAADLDLLPTLILNIGANSASFDGKSVMVIFWGAIGPVWAATRYLSAVTGAQLGVPGPSITLYAGAIAGFT